MPSNAPLPSADPVGVFVLVVIAGAGGLILSMINLWEDTKKPRADRVPKDFFYWLFFVFWPIAGAGLAWIYVLDGSTLRPLLALSIGLSAPTTIQSMIAKVAIRPGPPEGAEE
jgi:hypothetical protein